MALILGKKNKETRYARVSVQSRGAPLKGDWEKLAVDRGAPKASNYYGKQLKEKVRKACERNVTDGEWRDRTTSRAYLSNLSKGPRRRALLEKEVCRQTVFALRC